jgi:transcriptional regulator with XRE-family HTH domain
MDVLQPRNQGVVVNPETLARALALRAMTARKLAERSGVGEATISRARRGRHISEGTLRKLTAALLACPPMLGAELILGPGEPK